MQRQDLQLKNCKRAVTLIKNQPSMTSIKHDHLQVMATITGTFHQNPLKTVGGVAETRTSVDKMAITDIGPYSGKKQSSVTSAYMILFRSWEQ